MLPDGGLVFVPNNSPIHVFLYLVTGCSSPSSSSPVVPALLLHISSLLSYFHFQRLLVDLPEDQAGQFRAVAWFLYSSVGAGPFFHWWWLLPSSICTRRKLIYVVILFFNLSLPLSTSISETRSAARSGDSKTSLAAVLDPQRGGPRPNMQTRLASTCSSTYFVLPTAFLSKFAVEAVLRLHSRLLGFIILFTPESLMIHANATFPSDCSICWWRPSVVVSVKVCDGAEAWTRDNPFC